MHEKVKFFLDHMCGFTDNIILKWGFEHFKSMFWLLIRIRKFFNTWLDYPPTLIFAPVL